jgi:hypothetical protein
MAQKGTVSEGIFWVVEGTRCHSAHSSEYDSYPAAIFETQVEGRLWKSCVFGVVFRSLS